MKVDVAGLLKAGPLTLRDLSRLTGLDGRSVRREIERERRAGAPIVSEAGRGYWMGSPVEVRRFVRSMRRRASEIIRTAEAVRGMDVCEDKARDKWR